MSESYTGDKFTVRCSFCDEPESERRTLVRGPGVFICDECVGICVEILEEKSRAGRVKRFVENLKQTAARKE